MIWFNLILAAVGWVSILVLQFVLMQIAAFFEKNSGKRTWHRWYLVPIILSGFGAGRYIWHLASRTLSLNFTGDPLANLTLFFAGLSLIVLSSRLYDKMMGDHRTL